MGTSHPTPPDTLDSPLELDPADWARPDVYQLLNALVVPRPIAWISTVNAAGIRNLAPHSYFNVVSSHPPHVMFSSGKVKDTLNNVRETGEFVVNLSSMDLVEQMNATSTDMPADEDEWDWAGLESTPSKLVRPERIAGAKAHLECRATNEFPVGDTAVVVIAEVVHMHVDPSVWRDGRVRMELLDPVCRLAGSGYARLGETFDLKRPKWSEVVEAPPGERFPRMS